MSGPVWMYRKGEAKLFASPDEVPKGKGWSDSPSVSGEVETKQEPKNKKDVENGDIAADSDQSA